MLGLIPLVIFYLVKPKPDERMMPSIRFFMEGKDSGVIKRALDRLLRNLLLLLHVLVVAGVAAAIAEPYVMQKNVPDRSVILIDRSASMSDDWDQVRQFALENLGERNTVVVVDNSVSVPLESVPEQRAKEFIKGLEPVALRTDITAGLRAARGHRGVMVVASDLDQTVNSEDPGELMSDIDSRRRTKVFSSGEKNRLGIVEVRPGSNTTLEVKNYGQERRTVRVRKGDVAREIVIPPGATRKVSFETPAGKHVFRLPEDPYRPDNDAHVFIPERDPVEVLLLSDSGNRYLEKAFELMKGVEVQVVRPPVQDLPRSDVYIVGKTEDVLPDTLSSIESRVRRGASMVVFGRQGLAGKEIGSLPVKIGEGSVERSVVFQRPRKVTIGMTTVLNVTVTGDSLSEPAGALVKGSHGDGEVVFYNIRNRDFRNDFLYPVFWKDLVEMLTDVPSVGERNIRTGETVRGNVTTPGGRTRTGVVELRQEGFYSIDSETYAVNLLSDDESYAETEYIIDGETEGKRQEKRSLRSSAVAVLVLLLLIEMAYLYREGDLR